MRCPKCHYLSFDPEPRCKNCGYDLEVADAELAFKAAEEYSDDGPDLELRASGSESASAAPVTLEIARPGPVPVAVAEAPAPAPIKSEVFADLVSASDEDHNRRPEPVKVPESPKFAPLAPIPVSEESVKPIAVKSAAQAGSVAERPPSAAEVPAAVPSSPNPTTELPLFVRENAPPARPPLAVRRNVTDLPKPKARVSEPPKPLERRVGPLEDNLLEDLRRVEREEAVHIRDVRLQAELRARTEATAALALEASSELDEVEEIPATQRLAAASLDGLLLGGIGTFVLWAALRMTGAGLTTLGAGSLLPFGVFLVGVAIAYLLMFTAAGGQTLGKMLMGLRVVCDQESAGHRMTLGQAALRAVVAPFSVLALGLGWVPALFGDGLTLHDRLAHTRVVRA